MIYSILKVCCSCHVWENPLVKVQRVSFMKKGVLPSYTQRQYWSIWWGQNGNLSSHLDFHPGVYFAVIAGFSILGNWAQSGTNFPILSDIVPPKNRSDLEKSNHFGHVLAMAMLVHLFSNLFSEKGDVLFPAEFGSWTCCLRQSDGSRMRPWEFHS